MKDLLEHLVKEWSLVSGAPCAFLILAALAFGVVFGAFKWHYAAVIEQRGAANETLRQQVALLKQKNDDSAERSPDVLLARYEKRSKLLEQELAQAEAEKVPLASEIERLKSQLTNAGNVNMEQKQALAAQQKELIRYAANLDAYLLQLKQRVNDIQEPYWRFLNVANGQVSPGRRAIISEIINHLGVDVVPKSSPDELAKVVDPIFREVGAKGAVMFDGKLFLNGGCLTGLRSIGLIDDNDRITLLGVTIFKQVAKEMKLGQ